MSLPLDQKLYLLCIIPFNRASMRTKVEITQSQPTHLNADLSDTITVPSNSSLLSSRFSLLS